MKRGALLWVAASAALAITGCGGSGGKLEIRSASSGIAPGERPVAARIAEARGYFALGNVGLALESYRKALRDDPASVDALNGVAACYDKMGRYELSRRFYEEALALAPGEPRLYRNLALSLEMQGRPAEAASVRAEFEQRRSAAEAATVELARAAAQEGQQLADPIPAEAPQPAAAVPPPAPAVTVALAPPVMAANPAPAPAPLPGPSGTRLERLSLGEVALITGGKPVWRPRLAETARSRALPVRLTLLNAARVEGLAARTRSVLEDRGWRRIAIGNAPRTEARSLVSFPTARRAEATRLAQQLGLALRPRGGSDDRLVVLLGRDSIGIKRKLT